MRLRLAPLGIVLGLVAALPARAAQTSWPRFRGPDGAGRSDATPLPTQWTEKDYRWKVTLPAGGHSSPVVWGDRVFVTCADEKTALRTVCCLRAADGSLLWRRDYPSTPYRQHQFNHYASASPAADEERVYLTWSTPDEVTLLALRHDGQEAWRRTLGSFVTMHGSASSPVVVADLVVLLKSQEDAEGALLAVDRQTGATRWTLPRSSAKAAYVTPTLRRPEGGPPELLLASTGDGVTSIDPATGQINWELRDLFPERCVGSPAAASGLIVATCGVGGKGIVALAVRPGSKDGKTAPSVAWRLQPPVPYVPTPVAKGDLLFLWGDQGTVLCVRAATGDVLWRERVGGNFFGSPVCVGHRLYCIAQDGTVVVLAASDQFQLLARNPLGERSYATPALAGGTLYLRTYTHLIAVGGP